MRTACLGGSKLDLAEWAVGAEFAEWAVGGKATLRIDDRRCRTCCRPTAHLVSICAALYQEHMHPDVLSVPMQQILTFAERPGK